jgi:hypothetical protein
LAAHTPKKATPTSSFDAYKNLKCVDGGRGIPGTKVPGMTDGGVGRAFEDDDGKIIHLFLRTLEEILHFALGQRRRGKTISFPVNV